MKKAELVEAVATKTGVSKAEVTRVMDSIFETIKESLKGGNKVPVAGFGTFDVSKRNGRTGRNPRTGETIKIAARNAVTFKAGSALKDAVN